MALLMNVEPAAVRVNAPVVVLVAVLHSLVRLDQGSAVRYPS